MIDGRLNGTRPSPRSRGRAPFGALRCALLSFVLLALAGCADNDGPLQLKFGHVGAPGSLFALSAEHFASIANDRLGERAEVVVFGSSQLGGDELLLQKLKLGTVDLALPSSIMSSFVAEFGLFDMPYLVADRDHMKRIEERIVWPDLAPLAEASGFHIIGVWENGFRHVTNNARPIVVPEDLRGIKLRTPRGVWRVRMFQTLGANPTPMPLSEVFVALQTGVMDGQENPLAQIHASRFQEVQLHLSLTGHVYTPAYVTAGTERWSRLPQDIRETLEQAARETQSFVYETAARLDAELVVEIEGAGTAVNEIDRRRFVEASRPVYDQFGAEVPGGRELTERAAALAAGAESGPGR